MKALYFLIVFSCSLLFFSCQKSNNEANQLALSDSTSVTGLKEEDVKLVKTASIHFKVSNIEESTKAVSTLAQSYGGMVVNHTMKFGETDRSELHLSTDSLMVVSVFMPQADMTLRIPSENLEAFIYGVADIGYFTSSSSMNIDDRSLMYMENLLKQKNRRDALAQPIKRRDKGLTINRTIEVKDDAINKEMANRSIDADVKYSTVSLSLFQNPLVRKEIIANYSINDYQLSFGSRLANALSTGWQFFISFFLTLAHFWMFILITILVYFSYKFVQQKRKLAGLSIKR